jgi:uncharacterized protein YciI
MAYFLCRLKGPRPSFPMDMTASEAALMGEHAAYWQAEADRGTAIVFGPVMDPAGAWGLCILETDDASEPARLTEADPVIRAAAGFAYEIFPMPQVGLRAAQARTRGGP